MFMSLTAYTRLFTSLRRAAAWFVALWLGVGLASPGIAGPGALDPSFGSGGIVVTDFNGSIDDAAFAIAVQPDGKILAAGYAFSFASNYDFALVRYLPDGSLDAGFGMNGKVATDFHGSSDVAFAIALQPDGKIIAAGYALRLDGPAFDFALARYNADGSLDASFGVGGKVTTDFDRGWDQAHALLLQPDGKIVVAGEAAIGGAATDFALARYNADGSLDTSFGAAGKVTTRFAGGFDRANTIVLQADGKIVAAGSATSRATGPDFALVRYNADGSLDATFGIDGRVVTDFSAGGGIFANSDGASSAALQSDGKIVVAGASTHEPTFIDFVLARYNPDGSLDASFADGGKAELSFFGNSSIDSISGVANQPDGKIVVAGITTTATRDFALARYNADGRLDLTFGVNGKVATDLGNADNNAFAMALQPDGRIVIAGQAQPNSSSSNFALARYLNPEVITVAIDIKPGTTQNTINLGSGGNVPVAILSSDQFDATAVDPQSVRLAGASIALKGKGTPAAFTDDVNGDGRLDLVVHIETEALQLSDSDTQAVLTADTFDGRAIAGTDSVRIVR